MKGTIRTWPDKFKDLFFKKPIRFRILNIKYFWKYSYLTLNKWTLFWFLTILVDKTLGIMSEK